METCYFAIVFAVFFLQNISNIHSFAQFLNVGTFKQYDDVNSQFVLFYAPWCRHCKDLLPTWNKLADRSLEQWKNMKISKVNCIEETAFCSDQNILAYPTMKMYHEGDTTRFDGRRSLGELEIFIEEVLNNKLNIEEIEGLLTLTSENFDAHIKQGLGLHFVDFYAPWCIHCKRFEPTWKAIAKHYKDNPDITIGKIDCTVETPKCQRWGIRGFPSLELFQDGEKIDSYKGNRNMEELKAYINDKLYQHGLRVDMGKEADEPQQNPEGVVYIQSNGFVDNVVEDEMNSNPVIEVIDRTFDMLIADEPSIFINFYTPWSKESKEFASTWKNLGRLCQKEGLSNIAQIDCSKFPEVCQRYQIYTYPSLVLFQQGNRYHYKQEKSLQALHAFLKGHFDHDEL